MYDLDDDDEPAENKAREPSSNDKKTDTTPAPPSDEPGAQSSGAYVNPLTGEIGGPKGPEPTRYGDWENKGRVSDF